MSFNKKTIYIILSLILAAALVGCSGQTAVPTATVAPTVEEPTSVPTEVPATDVPVEETEAEAAEAAVVEESAAEETVEEVVSAPVEESTEKAAVEESSTEETAEEAVSEAAEESSEKAAAEEPSAEETAEEAVSEAAEESSEKAAAEEPAAEETVEEAVSETAEESSEKAAAEEPVDEKAAVEDTAESASEGAFVNDGTFAASVDGKGLPVSSFVEVATFNRYQYLNMYFQYAQMYSAYGLPIDSLDSQVKAILDEEGRERLGSESVDQLMYNEILRLEAENEGLVITDEEVYAQLKAMFGYEEPAAEEAGLMGMDSFNVDPAASESDADKHAAFRTFAEDVLAQGYDGKVSYEFIENQAKSILLDNLLFEASLEDRIFEAEMVSARHILVSDKETADDILTRLAAGEDWNVLASENSLDTANKDKGGNLGWFGRGQMVAEFENAAFALEPGEISEPVKTSYGYHIIASDGKEVRPLNGDALKAAQDAAYDEWTLALRSKHDVQSYPEVWLDAVPMEPAFVSLIPPQTDADVVDAETSEEAAPLSESEEAVPADETAVVETEAVSEAVTDEAAAVADDQVTDTAAEASAESDSAEKESSAEDSADAAVVPTEAVIDEAADVDGDQKTDTAAEAAAESDSAEKESSAKESAAAADAVLVTVTDEAAEDDEQKTGIVEQSDEVKAEQSADSAETAASVEEAVDEAVTEETSETSAETETGKPNVVALVNNEIEITSDEFVQMAVFSRYQLISNYNQSIQFASMFGMSTDSINEYYGNLLGESGKEELGMETIKQLVYMKMLDLEVAELGIDIPEKLAVDRIKTMVGYTDAVAEAETSLGLDSFNLDTDIAAEDSDADFRAQMELELGIAFNDKVSYDFYKNYVYHSLIESAIVDKLMEGENLEEEQVNARHILVDDEATAKEILAKLEAGEEWDALAAEYSKDESNKDFGGSLGWFGRDVMVPEFEDAVFAMEPGEISEPVKSGFGWHIIASDGKEMRQMGEDALNEKRSEVYEEYYNSLSDKYSWVAYPETWLPLVPMEPAFEPVVLEASGDDSSIPTFHIISDENDADLDEEDGATIQNTEQNDTAYMVNNDAESDVSTEKNDSQDNADSGNASEQKEDALILSNDTENK